MTAVLPHPTALTPACAGSHRLFDAAADAIEAAARKHLDNAAIVEAALDVCSACPAALKARCLSDALRDGDGWSVRGGTTPDGRRDLVAATWLQEPPTTDRHDRSTYNAGCRCRECTEANRAYVASRRAERCHTQRDRKQDPFEQLEIT